MDDGAGYLVLLAVLAFVGFHIWRGYTDSQQPALPMRDAGNGVMEPICPYCNARLITINRRGGVGFLGVMAVLLGLFGFVLLLTNLIAGAIILILAVLLAMVGKASHTVLTCPACNRYEKTIK